MSPRRMPLAPTCSRNQAAGILPSRTTASGTPAATVTGSSRSRKFLKMLPAHFMVGGNFSLRTWRMPAEIASSSTAGAFHGGRELLVAHLEDAGRDRFQFHGGRRGETEFHLEDDPLFVALEDAFAIAELALRVVKNAHPGAIEEAHGSDPFGDGMPVCAGVAIDRAAHPTGDAGERFQPL